MLKLRYNLPLEETKKVNPWLFFFSRRDFCNALFTGLPLKSVRLQLAQKYYCPITPALASLPCKVHNWFWRLNGLAPSCPCDCSSVYVPKRSLMSSSAGIAQCPENESRKVRWSSFLLSRTKGLKQPSIINASNQCWFCFTEIAQKPIFRILLLIHLFYWFLKFLL